MKDWSSLHHWDRLEALGQSSISPEDIDRLTRGIALEVDVDRNAAVLGRATTDTGSDIVGVESYTTSISLDVNTWHS
jgi:hypothetical protein